MPLKTSCLLRFPPLLCVAAFGLLSCDGSDSLSKLFGPSQTATLQEASHDCEAGLGEKNANSAQIACLKTLKLVEGNNKDTAVHALALERMGDASKLAGNTAQAVKLYKTSIAMRQKLPDKAEGETRTAQTKMAELLSGFGQLADAETVYKQILTDQQTAGKDGDSLDVAATLNALGMVQLRLGNMAAAEQSLRKALAIREKLAGPNDARTGQTVNSMAMLMEAAGKSTEAEAYFRKSLAVQEAALGLFSPSLQEPLSNLARLLQNTGRLQEAEATWQRAFSIAQQTSGKDGLDAADILNQMGLFYFRAKAFVPSENNFRQALAIREKLLGSNNMQTVETASNLGVVLLAQGKKQDALPLLRQAAGVTEATLGSKHPLTQQRWNNLEQLYGEPNAPAKKPAVPPK